MTKPEFLITLPKRGLQIIPPSETQRNMALARKLQQERWNELPVNGIVWSEQEKARIKLIKRHGPLRRRYPNPAAGRLLMECVDYDRREELLDWAKELSLHIASEWQGINPRCPIAVVLYGSVARGTVKSPNHPKPSDIDLFVTGNTGEAERQNLFNAIRKRREDISVRIAGYPDIAFAGVKIQPAPRLLMDGYNAILNYIGSSAVALHDPTDLWADLEKAALSFFIRKERGDPVMINMETCQRSPRRMRLCANPVLV